MEEENDIVRFLDFSQINTGSTVIITLITSSIFTNS